MALIKIENLKKEYKIYGKESQEVLKGIDLEFNGGEFVSVLGESGCGKSTLMNIIGGMDSDFSGDILIKGKSLKNMKMNELDEYRKVNIGFIFQSFNLISHLSVLENVTIAMQLTSKSSEERNNKAIELLTDLGLAKHLHKKPNQLSGGQKQRVAIARALANDPEIILADEPTGALDKATSEQILKILGDIAKKGKLVIAVTHSQKVARFGTRIINVDDGRVVSEELIKEKYDENINDLKGKTHNLTLGSSIWLALRNMKLNLKRNILVAIGGSVGILSVILMLSIGNGVKTYINDQIKEMQNPLLIQVEKEKLSPEDSMKPPNMVLKKVFEEKDIENIKNIKNVESVGKVYLKIMQTSLNYNNKNVEVMTLANSSEATLTDKSVAEGTEPKEDEIVIDGSLAKSLFGVEDSKDAIGKKVNIYIRDVDNEKKPIILEKEVLISGIYKNEAEEKFAMAGANTVVIVNTKTFEEIYKDKGVDLKADTLYVLADNKKNVDDIKESIRKSGYEPKDINDALKSFNNILNIITSVFVGIAGISLVVSSVMILVVMFISVIERTKEIGVLRAIGARKVDVKRIFLCEASLIGLFSAIIAMVLAFLLVSLGNNILMKLYDVKVIIITPMYLIIGTLTSVIISTLAGYLPARKASKMDPVESLRSE